MSLVRDGRTLAVPAHQKGFPFDAQAAKHALNVDRRMCKREVPLQVLVLGLPRTGTSSIRQALFKLGYFDVYHGVAPWNENPPDAELWNDAFRAKYEGGRKFGKGDWDRLLGHCMAVTDSPCALFAEDLIAAYPQAKVILTVRDSPQAWLGSMERTILPMVRQLRKKSLFDRFDSLLTPRSPLQEYGDKVVKYTRLLDVPWDFERMYSDHNAWIQRLVPQNNRLLVYNVKAGWGPLCEFLERQVPSDEFPRVNDSSVYAKNFALSQDEARKQIMKRTVKTLIAVLVVAIAVWASYFDGLRPLQYVISVD